jgi:hypothetical protein
MNFFLSYGMHDYDVMNLPLASQTSSPTWSRDKPWENGFCFASLWLACNLSVPQFPDLQNVTHGNICPMDCIKDKVICQRLRAAATPSACEPRSSTLTIFSWFPWLQNWYFCTKFESVYKHSEIPLNIWENVSATQTFGNLQGVLTPLKN